MTLDASLAAFEKFALEIEAISKVNLSEADTRCKMLDRLLTDVLGWPENEIQREGHVPSGFYDYLISLPTFKFIVEAKRNFAEFNLPKIGRRAKLRSLEKGNEDIIKQARTYAVDKGVSYGLLSNGHQLIVAQFVNFDGNDWLDNQAIFYRSLDEIRNNFIEVYNLLSRASVISKGRIIDSGSSSEPKILRNSLMRRDDVIVRNDLSPALVSVIDNVFRELVKENSEQSPGLLEKCYVKNEDIRKHNSELNILFEDSPPKFDDRISKVRNTDHTHEQIAERLANTTSDPPSPIVIIGGKGVGKTTFLNYFFRVSLPKDVKEKVVWVYLDFRSYTKQSISDTQLVCRRISEKLTSDYPDLRLAEFGVLRAIYEDEINTKIKGTWSIYKGDQNKLSEKMAELIEAEQAQPLQHLQRIANYLVKKCNKKLCLVFDNADQLDDESQEQAFILAQSLYRTLGVTMLLSLREGYFFTWKNKPPFDAYPTTVFHISAPRYREVLKKRFDYISESYDLPSIEGFLQNSMRLEIDKDAMPRLFENLGLTLFGNKNSEVLSYLEQTSYPNIRSGLEKLNTFLISGHTKIVQYAMSPSYNIPVWEFVKSVGLESNIYYQHKRSQIFNLYFPAPGSRSHFLKIRLLRALYKRCNGEIDRNDYFLVEDLVADYVRGGYSAETVIEELTLLLHYGLIETSRYVSDVDLDHRVRLEDEVKITYSGGYYGRELCGRFFYLDLVLQDTPIFSEPDFEALRNSFSEADQRGHRRIESRYGSVQKFVNYLRSQEEFELSRTLPTDCDQSLTFSIMKSYTDGHLKNDMDSLARLLEKSARQSI